MADIISLQIYQRQQRHPDLHRTKIYCGCGCGMRVLRVIDLEVEEREMAKEDGHAAAQEEYDLELQRMEEERMEDEGLEEDSDGDDSSDESSDDDSDDEEEDDDDDDDDDEDSENEARRDKGKKKDK